MTVNRILIIEPDKEAAATLAAGLRAQGFETTVAHSGNAAVRLARSLRPDLITLEVELPDLSGADVCRTLRSARETSRTPIVVISNRSEEIDRIVLFELGADDYITKPFSLREVALRVKARLRRVAKGLDARALVRCGEIELQLDAHRVLVGEREVMLTPTESRLLGALCVEPNRVFPRDELHDRVCGKTKAPGSRVIDAQVKRLRQKLGSAGSSIQTVRGVGYRFIDPAQHEGLKGRAVT